MLANFLIAVALLAAADPEPPPKTEARPVPVAGAFAQERGVTLRGYTGDAMEPFITKDGRYLLFNNRNEKPENTNLHFAIRAGDTTFDYRGEIQGVNTPALEGVPSLDRFGNLYFVSDRDYSKSFSTLYRGRFTNGVVTGVELVPGVSRREPGIVNFDAEISGDGATLWFVDGDFRSASPPKTADIVIAVRRGPEFVRLPESAKILRRVNTDALEYAPAISEDGLELFFTRVEKIAKSAQPQIFRAVRKTQSDAFDTPERITAITGFVEGPSLSGDGRVLYYHKREQGKFVICRVER